MNSRLAIDLDERLKARLEAAAAKADTTASALAADVIERAIDELEAWVEDEAAYANYERTGEAIPLAAVEDWVRSWGTANELQQPKPCKSSS